MSNELQCRDMSVSAVSALTHLLTLKEDELCQAQDNIRLLEEALHLSQMNEIKLRELEVKQETLLFQIRNLVEDNRTLRAQLALLVPGNQNAQV